MSYFKPRHRKVGILMLVVACAFTVAWIRSLQVTDQFTFACDSRSLGVHSGSGYLKFEVRRAIGATLHGLFENRKFWKSFDNTVRVPVSASGLGPVPIDLFNTKEREILGFVTTSGSILSFTSPETTNEIRANSFACPYVYVVAVFAIFAGYLLLTELRRKPLAV